MEVLSSGNFISVTINHNVKFFLTEALGFFYIGTYRVNGILLVGDLP